MRAGWHLMVGLAVVLVGWEFVDNYNLLEDWWNLETSPEPMKTAVNGSEALSEDEQSQPAIHFPTTWLMTPLVLWRELKWSLSEILKTPKYKDTCSRSDVKRNAVLLLALIGYFACFRHMSSDNTPATFRSEAKPLSHSKGTQATWAKICDGDSHAEVVAANSTDTSGDQDETDLSEEDMMRYSAMAVMGGELLDGEGEPDKKEDVDEKTVLSEEIRTPPDGEEGGEKENMATLTKQQTSTKTALHSQTFTSKGTKKEEVREKTAQSEEVRILPDGQEDKKEKRTPSKEEQTSTKTATLTQKHTSEDMSSNRQESKAKTHPTEALRINATVKTLRCVTPTEPLTPNVHEKTEEKTSHERMLKDSMYCVVHPYRSKVILSYPLPRDHRPRDMFAPQDRPEESGHQGAEEGDRHDSGQSRDHGSLDLQDMRTEYGRLASFHGLPPSLPLSPIRMAEAGWHLTGRGDETECFSCHVRHSGWRAEQCPLQKHQELSPHCNFLPHPHGNNVPILNCRDAALCRQGACRQRDSSSCRTLGAILVSAGAATSGSRNGQREQVATEAARQSAPRSYIPDVWSASSRVSSSTEPPSSLPPQPSPSLPRHPPTPSLPQQPPVPSPPRQPPSVPQQPPAPTLPRQPPFPSLPLQPLSPPFPRLPTSASAAGRSSPQIPNFQSPPFPSLPVLPLLPLSPFLPSLPSLPLLPLGDTELFADGPEETESSRAEERRSNGDGGGDHMTLQSNAIGSSSGQQGNATQGDRTERDSQNPGGQTQTPGGQGEERRDGGVADQRSGPSHPGYSSLERRLASFASWGSVSRQPPEELARLGFFFAGFGDAVRCHWCGLGLKDWSDDDVPLHEHVRWRSSCEFLRSLVSEREIFAILAQFARQDADEESEDDLTEEQLSNMSPADFGIRMPPKPQ